MIEMVLLIQKLYWKCYPVTKRMSKTMLRNSIQFEETSKMTLVINSKLVCYASDYFFVLSLVVSCSMNRFLHEWPPTHSCYTFGFASSHGSLGNNSLFQVWYPPFVRMNGPSTQFPAPDTPLSSPLAGKVHLGVSLNCFHSKKTERHPGWWVIINVCRNV